MLKQRLAEGVAILAELERVREETGTWLFGYDTECLVVARELRDLEEEIQNEPGPLERYLNPIRKRTNPFGKE